LNNRYLYIPLSGSLHIYLSLIAFFVSLSSVALSGEGRFIEVGPSVVQSQFGTFIEESSSRIKFDLAGEWIVRVNDNMPIRTIVPGAYDGVAEFVYERTFSLSEEMIENRSIELVAYGVNYSSEIWINGSFIGSHSGGYTSFSFPISPEILSSSEPNSIRVIVSNFLRARDTLPIQAQLWNGKNYGGILRDIYLLIAPDVSVHRASIRATFLDGNAAAELDLTVTSGWKHIITGDAFGAIERRANESYAVQIEVIDKNQGFVLAQSRLTTLVYNDARILDTNIRFIVRNPQLWSPEQPDLYIISVILFKNGEEYDRFNEVYGFRDISIRDGNIYLNGQLFKGRGILYHEYHPDFGSAVNYEVFERDVALMKIANVNLVRVAHRPPHPYLLSLFNRYGILCLIEIPAINVPGMILKNPNFISVAKSYLEEIIVRDRNHPSVLAWGIGDDIETPHQGSITYAEQLLRFGRSMDNRPFYAATQFPANEQTGGMFELGVINLPPAIRPESLHVIQEWRKRNPDTPLIIGKVGYYVEDGNLGGYSDPRSHEAQARYLLQMMDRLREFDLAGIVINSFADWRSQRPSMIVPGADYTLHTSGLLTGDRKQRRGFEVVRALYRGEKIPPLIVGEPVRGTPVEYVIGGFIVLIGFAYILNSSRRFRENVNRSLFRPYNFFADVRDQRILSGFHTLYLGILISLTMGMTLSSFLQHYQTNQILDYVFTHFLISDSFKELLGGMLQETWQLILFLAVLCFVMLVVTAIIVQICSMFVKTRVMVSHSFIVAFWSALPFVGFIPIAMILYNVLETEFYVVPILALLLIIALWVLFRLLKGMSIIYDILTFRVYVIGIFVIITINGIMLLISEYAQATFTYISFFISLMEGFKI
jgi:beta-galactosidase